MLLFQGGDFTFNKKMRAQRLFRKSSFPRSGTPDISPPLGPSHLFNDLNTELLI